MVNECFTRASNMHSILKIEKGDFFFHGAGFMELSAHTW